MHTSSRARTVRPRHEGPGSSLSGLPSVPIGCATSPRDKREALWLEAAQVPWPASSQFGDTQKVLRASQPSGHSLLGDYRQQARPTLAPPLRLAI